MGVAREDLEAGGRCPVPPFPLTPGQVDQAAVRTAAAGVKEGDAPPSEDAIREWIARRAKEEYQESVTVWEVILGSVGIDNAGACWCVNELRDRVVHFVRHIATIMYLEASPAYQQGTTLAAHQREFMVRIFAEKDQGRAGALGDDAEAIMAVIEDGTCKRMREKLTIICAPIRLFHDVLTAVDEHLHEAGKVNGEMAGWRESRMCIELGIDLEWITACVGYYKQLVAAGVGDPTARWHTRWGIKKEFWTRTKKKYVEVQKDKELEPPAVTAEYLAELGMELSEGEMSFIKSCRQKLAVSSAAGYGTCADADELPWTTGDMDWEITPGSPLAELADAAGLRLCASTSGTTHLLLSIARLFGFGEAKLLLLRLAAVGWLIPQHHSLLEVLIGSSEHVGPAALEAGPDVFSHLLPPDFRFVIPQGPTVTAASFRVEIEKEMSGTGDIKFNHLASMTGARAAYLHSFNTYRTNWPAHWVSPAGQARIAAQFAGGTAPSASADAAPAGVSSSTSAGGDFVSIAPPIAT
eukprot:TRINITY_DN24580_c0_g1_i1.p1 TRINITY_DN24580_c0_g1~~TRINITY_DN24580_c0_g1_i1.p1  ORF type:complete len:524 (+),score=123.84 TRINITY_DN24580_c0_g1_i1:241-1812(+)